MWIWAAMTTGGCRILLQGCPPDASWTWQSVPKSTLPGKTSRLPVKPFVNLLLNDNGFGNGNDSPVFFEAGLKTGIRNIFEIYVPLLVSKNMDAAGGSFKNRIRFVFSLDSFSKGKLNSN